MLKIINEGDAETLIEEGMCCKPWTADCFMRECALCRYKTLEFNSVYLTRKKKFTMNDGKQKLKKWMGQRL